MSKISLTFHLSFLRVNTNSKKVCIFAQSKYYNRVDNVIYTDQTGKRSKYRKANNKV